MTAHDETVHLRHACVVMASGMGTRFGGNKLMAILGEKPLIGHVLDTIDGLFEQCVVVTRHKNVAQYCESRGVCVVLHDEPRRNDTVHLGMEALTECDTVTFFQADQPCVSKQSVKALLNASEHNQESICRASFEEVPGSPVLFPAWTFPELQTLPEGKGGGFVAKKYPEHVRLVPVRDRIELFDVDTQEDLQYLETAIQQLRL